MYIQNGIGNILVILKPYHELRMILCWKLLIKNQNFFPLPQKYLNTKQCPASVLKDFDGKKHQIAQHIHWLMQSFRNRRSLVQITYIWQFQFTMGQEATNRRRLEAKKIEENKITASIFMHMIMSTQIEEAAKKVNRNVLNAIPIQVLSLFLD